MSFDPDPDYDPDVSLELDPDTMTRFNTEWALKQDLSLWNPDDPRPSHDPEAQPNGDYDENWVDLLDDREFWQALGVDTGGGPPDTLAP